MDLSKLDSNEKLAVYGAVASIVGPILASLGFGFGVGWFTLLLAIAMLAIVFMPQWSPQTQLPGSKGSLMLVVGGIAAVTSALALLSSIGFLGFFGSDILFVLGWLIGIAGGLLMGWAGWQEFQAEGGKFQLGSAPSGTSASTPAAPSSQPMQSAPPQAAPPPPPAAPANEPMGTEGSGMGETGMGETGMGDTGMGDTGTREDQA
jgi:hypothetical protein